MDSNSRSEKAAKIERVIGARFPLQGTRLLDFGCGSGAIASHFGNPVGPACNVDAADVVDLRVQKDFYRFTVLRSSAVTPWEAATFDVILSNHVLEHVGGHDLQVAYLREIRRLLAPGGVGYLALPNRWMVVEPHYRLAFLSWLPPAWRSSYLRLLRRGSDYDCTPLSMKELEACLGEAGLDYENICLDVLTATVAVEGKFALAERLASALPEVVRRRTLPLVPTLCYLLTRREVP